MYWYKSHGEVDFQVFSGGALGYPAEDLKSRRISCNLSLENMKKEGAQVGVTKGVFGRPYRSRTCDTLIKSHGVLV